MRILNYTPHVLRLYAEDRETVIAEIPSSGVARVATEPGEVRHVAFDMLQELHHEGCSEDVMASVPFPVASPTRYGAVEGLPEPQDGVVYVASMLVAQAAKRPDVLSPGTGPNDHCVRDAEGRIAGATRLVAYV